MALAMHEFPHWVEQDRRQSWNNFDSNNNRNSPVPQKKKDKASAIPQTAILDASIII
jgi:hypothetical protein